jgi:hypothetical protein
MRQIEEFSVGMHVAEVVVMFEESVLGVHHLRAGQRFRVGSSAEAELCWPIEGDALEPLVRVSPSGAIELCKSSTFAASIELLDSEIGGGALSFAHELDTGCEVATLAEHARAQIVFGEVSLLVVRTEAPRRRMLPPPIDLRAHATTAVVGIVFSLFLLAMNAIPPTGQSLVIDPFTISRIVAHVELTPTVAPPAAGGAAAGPAQASPAGGRPRTHFSTSAFGSPSATAAARSSKSPTERRALAEDAASHAGVLGVLQAMEGSNTGAIFGSASALSGEATAVMGSLDGNFAEGGSGNGTGTLVGPGHGGGGPGWGTEGLGGLGRIGTGHGGRSGYGCCGHGGQLGGRHASGPDFVPGVAEVRGTIDKEIIRRVVHQHLNEVKFCYEKELMKKPGLDGRVVTSFVIAGNGSVSVASVKESTMNDPAVHGCITNAIRRWSFPRPPSGLAFVTYPFAFYAAADHSAL